jgi:hypothetical protein
MRFMTSIMQIYFTNGVLTAIFISVQVLRFIKIKKRTNQENSVMRRNVSSRLPHRTRIPLCASHNAVSVYTEHEDRPPGPKAQCEVWRNCTHVTDRC